MNTLQLTGKRFGRLTVIKRVPHPKITKWLCRCDCGKLHSVLGVVLKRGETRSCGCLAIELRRKNKWQHGHSAFGRLTPTYRSWSGIIQRCTNPNDSSFFKYGARGIQVCDRWLNFSAFLQDMGECPPNHSIHRIDNDGDYCKKNCRWATSKEQARCRRSTHWVAFNGERLSTAEWAERLNIGRSTIQYRLSRGWPVEEALTRKVLGC